jgi:hypothetical protein
MRTFSVIRFPRVTTYPKVVTQTIRTRHFLASMDGEVAQ